VPLRPLTPLLNARAEGDLGVTPPLGVWDPLGLIESRDMRRYTIMEIKHGRAAMLGFLHVIHIEAGVRFPTEQCLAAPKGLIASLESMPTFAWLQIMLICCMAETGWGGRSDGIVSQFGFGEAQTTEKEPGDIGGRAWIRYDEPGEKAFKLNAERNNGRAAMLGITGCLLHEIVGVDALYPTGGFGGDAPREIIDQATAFSGFPSFS
jgi:light-harvesting complex I chlorophyll a/b binding protein 1